jgi:transcription initiation factor TFIID subunit 8
MLLSRRHETLPLDFEYALSKFSIPTASIEPHLKPPVAPPKEQEQEGPLPEEGLNRASLTKLLGEELDGENDKSGKSYVPKHFPSFPSKHTYKWTEKDSARETDPRKIREEAAKSARQAEEALRRLVKISKAGREKDVKRMAEKDPKSKLRHELWEKTMESLNTRKRYTAPTADQDDDRSMIVNSESQYFRKPVFGKRKAASIQAEVLMDIS